MEISSHGNFIPPKGSVADTPGCHNNTNNEIGEDLTQRMYI